MGPTLNPRSSSLILAPWFDSLLIGGGALIALSAGLALTMRPSLLEVLVAFDIAFLGYPHVVATFTRIAFDSESRRANRFLYTGLPVIVFSGAALVAYCFGAWSLATLYIYWQSFHYFRQSYGIARIYERKSGGPAKGDPVTTAMVYLVPLWGIIYRSYQQPPTLLGMEIRLIPVPYAAVVAVGALAVAAIVFWAGRSFRRFREHRLPLAHTLYLLTHLAIFGAGYLAIDDNSRGWVVINIWHNIQYILVVWLAHNGRFRGGANSEHRFLAALGKDGWRLPLFFAFCFGLAYVVYHALDWATGSSSVIVMMVVFQGINIHHYVVDGIIWKLRKPKVQEELRLAA